MKKTANKNVAAGYCPLDVNSLVPISNLPSISESLVTNLSTDLSACEKTTNKGGYCGLNNNELVSTSNIPQS